MILYFKERKRENLVFFLFVLLSLVFHAAAFLVMGLLYDVKPATAQRNLGDKVVKIQTMNIPPSVPPPSAKMPDYPVPPQPPPSARPPEKKKSSVPPIAPSVKPSSMPSARPLVPTPTPAGVPSTNYNGDSHFEDLLNFSQRNKFNIREDLDLTNPTPTEPPVTGLAQFKKGTQSLLDGNKLYQDALGELAKKYNLNTEQLLQKIYEQQGELENEAVKQFGSKEQLEALIKQQNMTKEQFLFTSLLAGALPWNLPSNLGQEPSPGSSPPPSTQPTPTPMPLPNYQQGNIGYQYIAFDHDGHTFRLRWDAAGKPVTISYYPQSDPEATNTWEMPWLDSWTQNPDELVQAVMMHYERLLKVPR